MRVGRWLTAGMTLGAVGTAAAAGVTLRPPSAPETLPVADAEKPLPGDFRHNFYFVRARYTDSGLYPNWKDWKTDFPKADAQFLTVFKRLADVDASNEGLPVRLDD